MHVNGRNGLVSKKFLCFTAWPHTDSVTEFFNYTLKPIRGGVLKNILILVEEKKNNLIQSFCHITMLNSGKINCATNKQNILTLVSSEKKILNETKNHATRFTIPTYLLLRSNVQLQW